MPIAEQPAPRSKKTNPAVAPAGLRIEQRKLSEVHPYAKNAKKHPKEQVDKLAAQIAAHGFDQPIVIEPDGTIIKGHGRALAARKLGMATVPVIVRGDLTPAQIRAARIADNKLAELGGWDMPALMEDVQDAIASLPDFDHVMTAFSAEKLGLEKVMVDAHERTKKSGALKYSVIVDFTDETAQAELLEELEGRGLSCRLLIS